jgi:hypothetical protein
MPRLFCFWFVWVCACPDLNKSVMPFHVVSCRATAYENISSPHLPTHPPHFLPHTQHTTQHPQSCSSRAWTHPWPSSPSSSASSPSSSPQAPSPHSTSTRPFSTSPQVRRGPLAGQGRGLACLCLRVPVQGNCMEALQHLSGCVVWCLIVRSIFFQASAYISIYI